MSHWYVYALHEIGDPEFRYIGVTSFTPEHRLKGHLKQAKSGHRSHKCNWIRSVGYSNIQVTTLQMVDEGDTARLHFSEILWVYVMRSCGMRLTNSTSGGLPELGFRHSDDVKEKLRQQSTGRNTGEDHWTYGLSTEDHPCFGTSRSLETREKQSKSLTGRVLSEEHRTNISRRHSDVSGDLNPFFGRKHTEDTRNRLSSVHTGKVLSEDTKRKMSESRRGVPKPGNAKNSHTRWHTNKNISKPETCKHCKEQLEQGSN